MSKRVINFSAGPCCLPLEVLETARTEMADWQQCGMGVMEMSHRGKEFLSIYRKTIADLSQLLDVPETHEILFMQGGATTQFASVPLNLFSSTKDSAAYAITGSWGDKAKEEALKYGHPSIACNSSILSGRYESIPTVDAWDIAAESKYLHYCANETVNGVEFGFTPDVSVPLVADMSSNFCSKPIDVARHTIIYAGVQKNLGPAGATVVIVDKEAMNKSKALSVCPTLLDYRVMMSTESMYNTPPCWSIYVVGLMAQYLKRQGGLSPISDKSDTKSNLLYSFIDNSDGYYKNLVEKNCRSRMNVPFLVASGDKSLESLFVKEATASGLVNLAGHRSVGGCRASLYNGMPIEGVEKLVEFMKDFQEKHPC